MLVFLRLFKSAVFPHYFSVFPNQLLLDAMRPALMLSPSCYLFLDWKTYRKEHSALSGTPSRVPNEASIVSFCEALWTSNDVLLSISLSTYSYTLGYSRLSELIHVKFKKRVAIKYHSPYHSRNYMHTHHIFLKSL